MTCYCCCENKDRYLRELEGKFGADVVERFLKRGGSISSSKYGYLDKSPEAVDYHNRFRNLIKQISEDKNNFCKQKK